MCFNQVLHGHLGVTNQIGLQILAKVPASVKKSCGLPIIYPVFLVVRIERHPLLPELQEAIILTVE